MSAVSRSSSLPASQARSAAAVALAAAVFLGAWALLHAGVLARAQIVDTPVYARYGEAITRGDVPYRDFTPEYPPLALAPFVPPALVSNDQDGYRHAFDVEMAVCGLLLLLAVAACARALRLEGRRLEGTLLAVAIFPLALGSVVLTRFDLWPAFLTSAALALLLSGRDRAGLGVLALAVAAKIYPGVLLPLALAWTWRRRGRREALVGLGVFVAVLAVCFVPFAALSPSGMAHSLGRQLSRPLQIESLGAGFLLAAHQAFGLGITMRSSAGSQNLAGTLPDVLAAIQTVLQAAALVYGWARFARGPAEPARLARYAAAAVVAFVALGKVTSPQFLIWICPLVVLVRGRRGLRALALLYLAMVLTHVWFPYRYWELVRSFEPVTSWLVPARNLVLVALLVVLAAPRLRSADG
jgi:uncharacterized membrane protein